MKTFNGARVQFTSVDPETEETYRLSLGDLKEEAEANVIKGIGEALNGLIDGEMKETTLTQTFEIA